MSPRPFLLALLLLLAGAAQARVIEEQTDLPVTVKDAHGREITHTIRVTVFRDDGWRAPAPVLVLNHGRAAEAQQRAAMGRARFTDAARFFMKFGFLVAVPTRIGYGVTGGEDVENSGPCGKKLYPPAYEPAAVQTLAVLDAMRQRRDAAPDRSVIVGQSFGGTTAAAVAAKNPPGIVGTINFAGGGGGNPKTRPGRPCAPRALEAMFRDYGRTARIPMLWIYSENDQYMGPKHPKEWFDAYVANGAPAEFVQYPPHGEDGHGLFSRGPDVWQPKVREFLKARGFNEAAR